LNVSDFLSKVSLLLRSGGTWVVDGDSYAGGSVATGRAPHAGQVKDKKGYSGPPGWGLGMRVTSSPPKIVCFDLRDASERTDQQKTIWL